jgi:hypothetical protein
MDLLGYNSEGKPLSTTQIGQAGRVPIQVVPFADISRRLLTAGGRIPSLRRIQCKSSLPAEVRFCHRRQENSLQRHGAGKTVTHQLGGDSFTAMVNAIKLRNCYGSVHHRRMDWPRVWSSVPVFLVVSIS